MSLSAVIIIAGEPLRFRVLPGLPAEGLWPVGFSSDGHGLHREGFVVEFFPSEANSWVGNFQPGGSSFNTVVEHPDRRSFVVVSRGQGYLIDPDTRALISVLAPDVTSVLAVPATTEVLVATFTRLQLVDAGGAIWASRDISWDGIENLKLTDDMVIGQGWSPVDDSWHPFRLNLRSRLVEGGCGWRLPV